jgi:signal transduction histidine kinase/CheY-like chemotaxis protein
MKAPIKASELDLDRILVRRPGDGLLELRGSRAVLLDAAASYRLAEELEETLGREPARGVLTRHGYQSGYMIAANLRTYFDWESDREWLLAGAEHPALLGSGRIVFEEFVVDRAKGLFRVVATVRNAFEACEHKRRRGPSADHVCDRLSGYLSGFGSAFMGDEVLFIEEDCAARSDSVDTCRIEGRLSADWGEAGERHRVLYRRDAIGERLASRDREVLAQAIRIREQELELTAKRKVEEANRLKSEFLANISHELRTPLNAILGYADLLVAKIGPKLADTPRQNLERILANADHLLGLINSILDISKVEAGRMEVHLEPVDPRPILDRCVEDTRVLVKAKPVEVIATFAGTELPLVVADRTRIKQCIMNVLGNAAKFTERGSIRVETRTITGQRSGRARGFLAISITDTGPGIASENHALIFEPFRQVDASATREHGGTGLGLPIVRQLLGLMGGEVQLTSEPGAGATFTLVVALASDAPATPARGARTEAEVFLLDDDPDFASITREAFGDVAERLRARLRVERDPIAAIAAARVRPPAVIVLDLRLPTIDGVEVLRLLKEDPRTREVPVIVVSARDDAEGTLSEGAREVLRKPVKPAELVQAIERALGNSPVPARGAP